MASSSLTIMIPTIGRPALAHTLASIQQQELLPGDEVLVVADGKQPQACLLWEQAKLPGRCLELESGPHYDWGHTPRNQVMPQAKGDYLLHMDDDDVYLPGAFAAIRGALTEEPKRPHLFRMQAMSSPARLIWHTRQKLALANVSTQIFVHPNRPETFGVWTNRYGGDFDFICSTMEHWPLGSLVWREEIICLFNDSLGEEPADLFRQHVRHPRNQRTLAARTFTGRATARSGISVSLFVKLARNPRGTIGVEEASFQCQGEEMLVPYGSLLTERITGDTLDRVRAVAPEDLLTAFGALGGTDSGSSGEASGDLLVRRDQDTEMFAARLVVEALQRAVSQL